MTDEEISTRILRTADELNERAQAHPIGRLQEIRARLKGLARQAASTIFTSQSIKDHYAFHLGGRAELQFNIGAEGFGRGLELRHGVAFSLETSRSFPDIAPLRPKVALFNEYMELYPDIFADMTMWHHRGEDLLGDRQPGQIAEYLVRPAVFIMLGKRQPFDDINLELILDDFDRLLPLYEFVESGGAVEPLATPETAFKFEPGFVERKSSAVVSRLPRELNVSLRHTLIQKALYKRLADEFGAQNVRAEQASGVGTYVDAVVRRPNHVYWFYEIKTSVSPRACIREALGQLLEYSNWPGSPSVERLIVVGEGCLDSRTIEYLERLRERFSLGVTYEQVAPSS